MDPFLVKKLLLFLNVYGVTTTMIISHFFGIYKRGLQTEQDWSNFSSATGSIQGDFSKLSTPVAAQDIS